MRNPQKFYIELIKVLFLQKKNAESAKIFPVMIVNIETNIYLCYV